MSLEIKISVSKNGIEPEELTMGFVPLSLLGRFSVGISPGMTDSYGDLIIERTGTCVPASSSACKRRDIGYYFSEENAYKFLIEIRKIKP